MSHALGACLDAALETARAEARACLERSLDVADASIRSAWGREISGALALGSSERAELEATNASLTERVADLEARCASLADQLRGAELAAATAAAETRAARAELAERAETDEARCEKLRAELEVFKRSNTKNRKRLEHAERALARVKDRAPHAAGTVEATRIAPDGATPRRADPDEAAKENEKAAAAAVAAKTPRDDDARDAPLRRARRGPALAPVAAAVAAARSSRPRSPSLEGEPRDDARDAAKRRKREGGRPVAHLPEEGGDASPDPGPSSTRAGTVEQRSAGAPPRGWRRGARGAGAGDEPSLWGERGGTPRGARRGGDAFAEEDREIFKIGAPREETWQATTRPADSRSRDARARALGEGAACREGEVVGAGGPGGEPAEPARAREVKHAAVVRDKAERAAMPAFACEECERFYAATARAGVRAPRGACTHRPGPGREGRDASHSRHRARWAPPPAPPGFWNLGMTQTQKST